MHDETAGNIPATKRSKPGYGGINDRKREPPEFGLARSAAAPKELPHAAPRSESCAQTDARSFGIAPLLLNRTAGILRAAENARRPDCVCGMTQVLKGDLTARALPRHARTSFVRLTAAAGSSILSDFVSRLLAYRAWRGRPGEAQPEARSNDSAEHIWPFSEAGSDALARARRAGSADAKRCLFSEADELCLVERSMLTSSPDQRAEVSMLAYSIHSLGSRPLWREPADQRRIRRSAAAMDRRSCKRDRFLAAVEDPYPNDRAILLTPSRVGPDRVQRSPMPPAPNDKPF
jgi:hypothetical protein